MKTAAPGSQPKLDDGLDVQPRARVAIQLARVLADSYALYVKTHGFHWNVSGPRFVTLHPLFQVQYEDLARAIDEVGERIRALGGLPPGTASELGPPATIREAKGAPHAALMLEQLAADHETLGRTCTAAMLAAFEAQDEATVDLLVRRMTVHEKAGRMLRSQLA